MTKYRIEKIGFGYYVQYYGIVNYDGILDYAWKDVRRFDTYEEAKKYIELMEG
jgi:hypothetical protein